MPTNYDPKARYEISVHETEYRRTPKGRPLMARAYQPKGSGPFPVLLDLHGGADGLDAFAALPDGVPFVRAERGMLDQPTPLYPDLDTLSRLKVTTVPGTNHYSILFSDAGVSAVVASLS